MLSHLLQHGKRRRAVLPDEGTKCITSSWFLNCELKLNISLIYFEQKDLFGLVSCNQVITGDYTHFNVCFLILLQGNLNTLTVVFLSIRLITFDLIDLINGVSHFLLVSFCSSCFLQFFFPVMFPVCMQFWHQLEHLELGLACLYVLIVGIVVTHMLHG